jgi:hypothetical protein
MSLKDFKRTLKRGFREWEEVYRDNFMELLKGEVERPSTLKNVILILM